MGQAAQRGTGTVEDLYAMPEDGFRYELQTGLIVSEPPPGFRHGSVAATISRLIGEHVRRRTLDLVVVAEVGFVLTRSPDTVRAPDVAAVARERVAAVDTRLAFPGAPDLAVEIVSPGNTPAELHAKVADYLAAGSPLVWVVDPESETVDVYRELLAPRRLSASDTIDGEEIVPGFRVTVSELFES